MAGVPQSNFRLKFNFELMKKVGGLLGYREVKVIFRTYEQMLGGKRYMTHTKTFTTSQYGSVGNTIDFDYEFDEEFGVKVVFEGDDYNMPLTVQLPQGVWGDGF